MSEGISTPESRMSDSLQSLLDCDIPSEYREEVTLRVAAKPEVLALGTESVVLFRIHNEWMALSTALFRGVADVGPVHSLPGRSGALLGLTNVDGELLVCVSLAALLGGTAVPLPSTQESWNRLIIIKGRDGTVVFPTHEVHGVHRYHAAALLEIPATLAHAATRFTRGMIAWKGHLVARLEDDLLLRAVTRALS
jgi:chemotaxis-related protein WspD